MGNTTSSEFKEFLERIFTPSPEDNKPIPKDVLNLPYCFPKEGGRFPEGVDIPTNNAGVPKET